MSDNVTGAPSGDEQRAAVEGAAPVLNQQAQASLSDGPQLGDGALLSDAPTDSAPANDGPDNGRAAFNFWQLLHLDALEARIKALESKVAG